MTYQCTATHHSIGFCDFFNLYLDGFSPFFLPPPKFTYVNDAPVSPVFFNKADYCPMSIDMPNYDCKKDMFGEFLDDGLCINIKSDSNSGSQCATYTCNEQLKKLQINLFSSFTPLTCNHDFELFDHPEYEGVQIECPRLAVMCPDFICPANCSGKGICNHDLSTPKCECFDSNDNSASCNGMLVDEIKVDLNEEATAILDSIFAQVDDEDNVLENDSDTEVGIGTETDNHDAGDGDENTREEVDVSTVIQTVVEDESDVDAKTETEEGNAEDSTINGTVQEESAAETINVETNDETTNELEVENETSNETDEGMDSEGNVEDATTDETVQEESVVETIRESDMDTPTDSESDVLDTADSEIESNVETNDETTNDPEVETEVDASEEMLVESEPQTITGEVDPVQDSEAEPETLDNTEIEATKEVDVDTTEGDADMESETQDQARSSPPRLPSSRRTWPRPRRTDPLRRP